MSETTYSPESIMARAETVRDRLKAAEERVDEVALYLAKTTMRPVIYERVATIQGHLGKAAQERTIAEFACEIELYDAFPVYREEAVALAFQDGKEVNL